MAKDADVPNQSLINLYLRDCVMKHRKVQITWPSSKACQFVQAENSVGRGYAPDGSCPHQGDAPDLPGPLIPLHAQHPPRRPHPRHPHAPWPHTPPPPQPPPRKPPHTTPPHATPTPTPHHHQNYQPPPTPHQNTKTERTLGRASERTKN